MSETEGSPERMHLKAQSAPTAERIDEETVQPAELEAQELDLDRYYPQSRIYLNFLGVFLFALYFILTLDINRLLLLFVLAMMGLNYLLIQRLLVFIDNSSLAAWEAKTQSDEASRPVLWYTCLPLLFLFIILQCLQYIDNIANDYKPVENDMVLGTIALLLIYDLSLVLFWTHEDQMRFGLVGPKVHEYVFVPMIQAFYYAWWGMLVLYFTTELGLGIFLWVIVAIPLMLTLLLMPTLSIYQMIRGIGVTRSLGVGTLWFVLFVIVYDLSS